MNNTGGNHYESKSRWSTFRRFYPAGMVESKQGINMDEGLNFLQTFNPADTRAELLEKTLIGRKELVDLLEKLVFEGATTGNKHQRLIIGPRGSGKTHLLRVLYNRVSIKSELKEKLKIAYLCEDEYGIAAFLDFLVRIFNAFVKWDTAGSQYLVNEIENLKKTPIEDQEKAALQILLNHIEGTTLLILIENIGSIFENIGDTGQKKLRDLVQQYPVFTIVATNQALFQDIRQEDKPFHNFFKITHLDKLTLEETILLLKAIAEWEKRDDLLQFLDQPEGKGRIHAIYDLTGGNHRLIVTFYYFLKVDYKNELSYSFIKTINDLIPYYQSFMDRLMPQQQKIIQYLCQIREPSNVKNIASNCFATENTISKQMSNLVRLKYVDRYSSGKETFYELAEPLLRICFEVKENRGGPVKLFINFLGNLYSVREIKKKFIQYHLFSRVTGENKSACFNEEHHYYRETLKQYFPEEYRQIENEGFEQKELNTQIHNYIDMLEKDGDYSDIIHFTSMIREKDRYLVIKEAGAYEQTGDIEKAIENATSLLKENKNDIDALLLLGKAYLRKKEYKISEDYFKQVLQIDEKNFQGLFGLGKNLAYQEKYTDAEGYLLKALKKEPENVEILRLIGIIFGRLKKYTDAYGYFLKMTEIKPDYSDGWRLAGNALVDLNKIEEAKKNFLKAIELDKNNAVAFENLGILFFNQNNYVQAFSYFKQLTEMKPDYSDGWRLAGNALENLNKIEEAKKSYLKAIELDKNNETAFRNLGILLFNQRDYVQAYNYFKQLTEIKPDYSDGWRLAGNALEQLNKIEEAKNSYIKAIELDEKNCIAIENYSMLLNKYGEYEQSYNLIKKCTEIKPDCPEAWRLSGKILEKLNRIEEAKKYYLKAIELDAGNMDALLGIARILIKTGKTEEAGKNIENILKNNVDDSILNNIGEIYRENTQFEKAIPFYEQAISLNPDSHHPYFNIVICRTGLNTIHEALQALEQALVFVHKNKLLDEIIPNFEEIITTLFIHVNKNNISQFLDKAIMIAEKYNYSEQLVNAIPPALFTLLIKHKEIELMRFEWIENTIQVLSEKYSSLIIPAKFFNIGIRHLKKNEKNVLFEFTKEERTAFNEFVLEKMEK